MITIKKYNKAEHSTGKCIKGFITNHPILIGFITILILLFSVVSLMVLLLLTTVGGACAEIHAGEQVELGTMTITEYITLLNILDIVEISLNYWYTLIKIILFIPVIILLRSAYTWYLEYKHDNL